MRRIRNIVIGIGISTLALGSGSYLVGRYHGRTNGMQEAVEILNRELIAVGEQGRYANSLAEQDKIADYCKGLGNAIDVLERSRKASEERK